VDTGDFSAAGVSIFGGALKSSNFSSGSAGWRIKSDGSAEFNGPVISRQIEVASGSHFLPAQYSRSSSAIGTVYTKELLNTGYDVDVAQVWTASDHTFLAYGALTGGVSADGGVDGNAAYWGVIATIQPFARWFGFTGKPLSQRILLKLELQAKSNGASNLYFANGARIDWVIYKVT
jgi:hypothetical protein